MDSVLIIERLKVRQLALSPAISLSERLSDVKSFDVVLVELQLSSGDTGYGDALIVDGTTPETLEQAWMIVCTLADASIGAPVSDATALYLQSHRAAPHGTTALVAALEAATGEVLVESPIEVPLVGLVDTSGPIAFADSLETLPQFGRGVIRVPLTGDVPEDLGMLDRVREVVGDGTRFRLYGDQTYTPEDAIAIVTALDPSGVEWLDQPCAAGDWDALAAVKDASPVPLAASGFIYDDDDIANAAATADTVGFGFAQIGGAGQLRAAIRNAETRGLGVFIGGSLQSDLTTLLEVQVSDGAIIDLPVFSAAAEPLLSADVFAEGVRLTARPMSPLRLNEEALASCTLQELSFG